VRRLLEAIDLPPGIWLEPGAGNGRIIQAMYEDRPNAYHFIAVETRAECRANLQAIPNVESVYIDDFLTWNARDACAKIKGGGRGVEASSYFTGAILNPAFPITMEVLGKCLTICDQVHMLQRLNWLGCGANNGKNDFLQGFMPDIAVVPDRIQFMIDGKFPVHPPGAVDSKGKSIAGRKMGGDSIDYCWYSWHAKHERFRRKGEIYTLDCTSLEERLAG
jgi:hypothetical protein